VVFSKVLAICGHSLVNVERLYPVKNNVLLISVREENKKEEKKTKRKNEPHHFVFDR